MSLYVGTNALFQWRLGLFFRLILVVLFLIVVLRFHLIAVFGLFVAVLLIVLPVAFLMIRLAAAMITVRTVALLAQTLLLFAQSSLFILQFLDIAAERLIIGFGHLFLPPIGRWHGECGARVSALAPLRAWV